MVRIRKDHSDFSEYTIFELIQSYWMDILKSKDSPRWRYFWWKFGSRHQLIDTLEKK